MRLFQVRFRSDRTKPLRFVLARVSLRTNKVNLLSRCQGPCFTAGAADISACITLNVDIRFYCHAAGRRNSQDHLLRVTYRNRYATLTANQWPYFCQTTPDFGRVWPPLPRDIVLSTT